MRTLLNVLWLILCGWWLALTYALAGLVMFVLVITIPFGIASFRLAVYALWPFGYKVVQRPDAGGASVVGNVLWFLLAGVWIALAHLGLALALAVTIIGIPFAYANLKFALAALTPLGKEIVPNDDPRPWAL